MSRRSANGEDVARGSAVASGMTDTVRAQLERAIEGLLYSTESDRPFTVAAFSGVKIPVDQLTASGVAELVGAAGAKVTEIPFARLLARQIAPNDPENAESHALAPRYADLARLLGETFVAVRVFRVGVTEVRILALGNHPSTGELMGIETVAVET
jgi:hypothetical protein